MTQASAQLNHLHIAPRKVRLVADLVRGLSIYEAEAHLMTMRQRSAPVLLKLLRSAIANAKNKNLKQNMLALMSIRVSQGPTLKRFMPRAQGRSAPIHKKTSHITIVLAEGKKEFKQRFMILPKEKKKEKAPKFKERKEKKLMPIQSDIKTDKKASDELGLIRRIFKRKVI